MNISNVAMNFGDKNLIKIVLVIQFAVLGLIGLDCMGIKIPLLRQVACFIYLSFIPGILVLRILKLHKINVIEAILYSIGLSLSFLMFTGVLINYLYPLVGISKPISEISLVVTISVIIFILCFGCHLLNKKNPTRLFINTDKIISPFSLFLLLLPFLAVFGTYLFNFYNDNTLLLILIAIISILFVFIAFDKVPEESYPLVVWVTSISLLFHVSLVSIYVSNLGDANISYYYSQMVILNNYWDMSNPSPMNSMLNIVMIIPIYSIVSNLSLTWTYKIVYPLLYSFTPIILYLIFKKEMNTKVAFFSSCFFMVMFPFYTIMQANVRTGMAELFLVLFMLTMFNDNLNQKNKTILMIIFMCSLATSHYGTSYIVMIALLFYVLINFLLEKIRDYNNFKDERIISLNFITIYAVFLISWYIYTSNSTSFNLLVNFANHFVHQLSDTFLELSFLGFQEEYPLSIIISRDILLILYFFIVIGILHIVYRLVNGKNIELGIGYVIFSISFFMILLMTMLPTHTFYPGRVGHICLCFLAPFSIIGMDKSSQLLLKFIRKLINTNNDFIIKDICKIYSVFIIILLVFSTGFISEIVLKDGDYSSEKLIHKERWNEIDNLKFIYDFYRSYYPEQDVFSAKWLFKNYDTSKKIYVDGGKFRIGAGPLKPYMGSDGNFYPMNENITIYEESYIYLRYLSIVRGKIIEEFKPLTECDIKQINSIPNSNKIYSNGGSEIYHR